MEIYTEEQVITFAIKVLSDYEINGTFYNREKLKEQLDATPIELPSDEEIDKEASWLINDDMNISFKEGAIWMKEQILNQNK